MKFLPLVVSLASLVLATGQDDFKEKDRCTAILVTKEAAVAGVGSMTTHNVRFRTA